MLWLSFPASNKNGHRSKYFECTSIFFFILYLIIFGIILLKYINIVIDVYKIIILSTLKLQFLVPN